MKLLLDTNILCQDYHLASPGFRLLFDGLDTIPAVLKIPEVVIDEVVNRFREDLEEALEDTQKAQTALRRVLGSKVTPRVSLIHARREAKKYRSNVIEAVKAVGGEILPYPEIPHKKIVERDLGRKKPFKRNGSGYRDFLIWESVRRLMLWGTEQVVFISNNAKDFGEGPLIDAELQSEILNPQRLQLFRSLKDFNETFVLPRLKMLADLKARLESEALPSFDMREWLGTNLLNLLRNCELGPIVTGFPEGVGRVWTSEIVKFTSLSVDEVRELESGEKLVRLAVVADVEVSVDIDGEDYVHHQEVRDWAGKADEPFSSLSSQAVENLTLHVALILDRSNAKVTSQELISIRGPYGSEEIAAWKSECGKV